MATLVNPFMVQAAGGGATVPGAPTITDVGYYLYDYDLEQDVWQAYIRIAAPASDGGSAITSYRQYYGAGFLVDSYAPSGSSFVVGSIRGQTVYATAVNAVGEGPPSTSLLMNS